MFEDQPFRLVKMIDLKFFSSLYGPGKLTIKTKMCSNHRQKMSRTVLKTKIKAGNSV